MHESERAEFGKMLLDVFRGLVIGIVVFALMVTAIFLSSEYEWNQQVKRLELEKKRIQLEQIAKASSAYTRGLTSGELDLERSARSAMLKSLCRELNT